MADPGGGAQHHRQFVFLGYFIPLAHHLLGFPGAAGVQHRHLGEHGEKAGILLRLGAVGPGVVGGDDQEAALDPQIGGAQKGVRGHVEAHLLHGDRSAAAAVAVGQGRFKSHLFVHRPLGVEGGAGLLGKGHHGLQDLRGRGAGVGGGQGAAALDEPPAQGLVAHEEALGVAVSRSFYFHNCYLWIGCGLDVDWENTLREQIFPPFYKGGSGGIMVTSHKSFLILPRYSQILPWQKIS